MIWQKILKHRTDIVVLSLLVIGVGVVFLFIPSKLADDNISSVSEKETTATILIGDHQFTVEVADTPEAREQGLSDHESLLQDHGMLFVFDQPAIHTFWMEDMQFPLDFVWINGNTVIDIIEDVQPFDENGDITTIQPRAPADKVLEVNAGSINTASIKVGDKIILTQ